MRTSDMAFRLLNFCLANDLMLRNTFFNHKDIHLATWTGPGDRNAHQIDFLAMRRVQARAMLNCEVHRGAELGTGHCLSAVLLQTKLESASCTEIKAHMWV